MRNEYTFYDYIDDNGENVISGWLNGDGKDSKAYFSNIIPHLEQSPPPWISKYTTLMQGEWAGFIEVRKTGEVQYRLLGQMIGRNVYLVATAVHKDQHYISTISPQKARERIKQMINNPLKYRSPHDYR